MNTNSLPSIVQFVGGPSDGLILTEPHFEGRQTLRVPVLPALASGGEMGGHASGDDRLPAYALTCRLNSFDAGQPATCLRYDFLGYGAVEGAQPRRAARNTAINHRWKPRTWVAAFHRRLGDWLMQPIDYPLNVARLGAIGRGLVSADGNADARA